MRVSKYCERTRKMQIQYDTMKIEYMQVVYSESMFRSYSKKYNAKKLVFPINKKKTASLLLFYLVQV